MQLHEAGKIYNQHRDMLNNIEPVDHVWSVEYDKLRDGYYLLLHFSLGDSPMPDDPDAWFEQYEEARHITKQRGGKRIFKSLDAVAAALQQIGQDAMPLDRLKLI